MFIDRRTALVSAFAAALAQGISCLFWIVSGWPLGVSAPVMAGIYCMFFASLDNPLPAIRLQFIYITLSTVTAGLYLLLLLPSAHSFEMLAMMFAPFLLVMTVLMVKPATSMRAMPFMMLTICSLTMFDTGTADMTTFMNSQISQSIGVGLSILFTRLFRIVSVASVTRHLVMKIWEDIAGLANSTGVLSTVAVSVRIVDGISLLAPRLSQLEKSGQNAGMDGLSAAAILSDLCVWLNMVRLLRQEKRLLRLGITVRPLLEALSMHYRDRMAGRPNRNWGIREMLDAVLEDIVVLPANSVKKISIAAVAGIRRDLFRDIPFFVRKSAGFPFRTAGRCHR